MAWDWNKAAQGFGEGFGQGFDQSRGRGGSSGTASPIAGIIPKILKRRRYKTDAQASNTDDTGVPDYLSPQGTDPYDDKWGY